MSGKIVTTEGKEFELTTNREELTNHLLEAFDQFRAGIIDAQQALTQAAIGKTIIANEVAGLLSAKLGGGKPDSKYFNSKQIG